VGRIGLLVRRWNVPAARVSKEKKIIGGEKGGGFVKGSSLKTQVWGKRESRNHKNELDWILYRALGKKKHYSYREV